MPKIHRIFVQVIRAASISKPIHMESLQSAQAALETALRVAVFFAVEYAFTAVDRSPGPDGRPRGEPLSSSSFVLQAAHLLILAGLASRVSGDKK